MQHKHASKRLLALLLTLVMLLGSLTTVALANEDDGPYEPIIDYLDMQHYSPEPRPAEAFSLSFELFGRPTRGYAFTAEGFTIDLTFVDPDSYAVLDQQQIDATSLVHQRDEYYVATVDVDASAYPNSRMIIGKVMIDDGSGFIWEQEMHWELDIAEGYSTDISITGMRTDKNVVELSDANYDPVNGITPETIKLTMELDVPAGFTIPTAGYDLFFQIENDNDDFHTTHEIGGGMLSTDSNGKTYAEWEMGIDYFWGEGNYTINWVKFHDFSKEAEFLPMNGSNIALRVDRSKISDKSAPAITDFYFSLNGVKQTEGGFRVKPTDTVKFHIAATDSAHIQDNTVGLMSEIFGECNLQATYDTAKGELICTVPVAYMDATEWYMNYFHAVDIYENIDAFSLWDHDDFDDMKHLYFFLEDADGECAVNTYGTTFVFHTNRLIEYEDGYGEWEVVEISMEDLPRIYSLSDVLGSRIPTAAIPVDGLTFEGWYCPDTMQSYFTAADDTMLGEYGYVDLYPAYDQAWVEIVCSFINLDGARIWNAPVTDVVIPYGSTVQDVIDAFEAAGGVDHELYPGSVISEWFCYDDLDMVITPQTTGIALQPHYEKFPVLVNYGYVNEEGFYQNPMPETEVEVFVSDGDTVADIVEAAGLNELTHFESLNLVTWDAGGIQMDDTIDWSFESLWLDAIYDKLPVKTLYGYWDENGDAIVGVTALLVDYGATYQDVLDAFDAYAATLEHWDAVNFTEWMDVMGVDPNESVGMGLECGFVAQYEEVLPADWGVETSVMVYYYDEDMNYAVEVVPYDADADMTYSQMIAEALKNVKHNSNLVLKEWKVGNYEGNALTLDGFLSLKAHAENVTIYVEPVYTDRIVTLSYSYLNENNETVEESFDVALPDGEITIDDVLAKVELPTDHSKDGIFVEWSYWTDDLDEYNYVHATAVYEKYPYNYAYTYMTQLGETETVFETVLVPAGTDALAYFDTLTAPHTSNMTFKRWVLTKAPDGPVGEVSLWGRNLAAMAEYEQSTPICVEFQELNDALELVETQHICYVNGTTDDTDLDEMLNNAVSQAEPNVSIPDGFEIMGAGDMFEDYIPLDDDNHYSGLHYKFWISYDKAVLYMYNPDYTITKVVVNDGEDYILPTTYDGKAIKWSGPLNSDGTVTVWGHITEVWGAWAPVSDDTTDTPALEMTGSAVDEAVKDVASAVENGEKEVTVDMTDKNTGVAATVIPQQVLEAAQGTDVTVKVEMGNNVTWTIKGTDIDADKIQSINLGVEIGTNAIPEDTVNTVANKNGKENPTVQISLAHEGEFGFKAELQIYVGTEYAGQYANLYYHNVKADGKLDFQSAAKVDENGYAQFDFNHASDYVIVMDQDNHTPAPATGDSFPMMLMTMALLISAAGIVVLGRKAKRA